MPVHVIDKPLGLTSHDVVARARRLLGTRRVGHAGTLDPLATGVLLILSEDATKLSPWLTGSDKTYLAWVAFGASTPSWDAEGPVEATGDATLVTSPRIEAASKRFLTLTEQVPPRHSAIKQGGEAAYRAAHRGDRDLPPMPPRAAAYRSIDLLGFGDRVRLPSTFAAGADGWRPAASGRSFELPDPLGTFPTALFAVTVAAGTYLRAFARDLGSALGVPAHLAGLVRTRAGNVDLGSAFPLEEMNTAPSIRDVDALSLPRVKLDPSQVARVRQGQRLPLRELGLEPPEGEADLLMVDAAASLVAIATVSPAGMRFKRVVPAPKR